MLGAVVSQIGSVEPAKNDTIIPEQARGFDLMRFGPAGGAEGTHVLGFARPVDRHEDGDSDRDEPTRSRNTGALQKDVWRVSIEKEPPPEESRRRIDRQADQREPG